MLGHQDKSLVLQMFLPSLKTMPTTFSWAHHLSSQVRSLLWPKEARLGAPFGLPSILSSPQHMSCVRCDLAMNASISPIALKVPEVRATCQTLWLLWSLAQTRSIEGSHCMLATLAPWGQSGVCLGLTGKLGLD